MNDYKEPISKLKNAVNDANAIAAALEQRGFNTTKGTDLGRRELNDIISAFCDCVKRTNSKAPSLKAFNIGKKKKIVLVFYAGHGMQAEGENYIIPIDAIIKKESDIADESISLTRILERIAKEIKPAATIVILDACRNNPFGASRSVTLSRSGLAEMRDIKIVEAGSSDDDYGTFIMFATAPNDVADDGDSGNGLFTQHLLQQLSDASKTTSADQIAKDVA